jgi:hypothetical protein
MGGTIRASLPSVDSEKGDFLNIMFGRLPAEPRAAPARAFRPRSMLTLLLFVLLLWTVTAIHELGHALAVRLRGGELRMVRVGAGPGISRTDGAGCTWSLGFLPVGGRIQYRGISPGTGRAVVAIAGPLANLVVALALLPGPESVASWGWLVPGGVLEFLTEGSAPGFSRGMRVLLAGVGGVASGAGSVLDLSVALGAMSAIWAAVNLVPVPGVGTDGWVLLREIWRGMAPGGAAA